MTFSRDTHNRALEVTQFSPVLLGWLEFNKTPKRETVSCSQGIHPSGTRKQYSAVGHSCNPVILSAPTFAVLDLVIVRLLRPHSCGGLGSRTLGGVSLSLSLPVVLQMASGFQYSAGPAQLPQDPRCCRIRDVENKVSGVLPPCLRNQVLRIVYLRGRRPQTNILF